MNTTELALRLAEIGVNASRYRVGTFGNGTSDAIVLRQTATGFEVFYTERGHDSLLASFHSETDACSYVLSELTKDESFLSHCVGTFDTERQAIELASQLSSQNIRVKTDAVPFGPNSKQHRVFVFGTDLKRVQNIRGW